MKSSRLLSSAIWVMLSAEVIFLLLPRTILDLRVINFFITANDQPAFEGQVLGMGILSVMMAIELFGLFTLWWLALRCTKTTIKEIPTYIGIGAAISVAWMLNFILPILWALVAIPLFATPKQFWLLQGASIIVTATAFAIMYWTGKRIEGKEKTVAIGDEDTSSTKWHKKWKYALIATFTFVIGASIIIPVKPRTVLTLDDAAKQSFRVNIKGAPFDIPVNYHYNEYSYFKKWPRPTQGEIDGTERHDVDFIKVTALLPNMSPYTLETAEEFEKPGWGRKVKVLFGHKRNFYWDNFIKNQPKEIQESKLRDMLHYQSWSTEQDEYISPDHLILIRCDNRPSRDDWYPDCTVKRPYRYKVSTVNPTSPEYYFEYTFSREHLQQWREIDAQVQALFDRFAATAQQH